MCVAMRMRRVVSPQRSACCGSPATGLVAKLLSTEERCAVSSACTDGMSSAASALSGRAKTCAEVRRAVAALVDEHGTVRKWPTVV